MTTTMTGPDLTGARAALEALMDDACTITADYGTADAVLDPATLQLTEPAPPVRYVGRCFVSGYHQADQTTDIGDAQVRYTVQAISVPLGGAGYPAGAQPIAAGDIVTLTDSRNDPWLITGVYVVERVDVKSFAVKRTLQVRHRPDGARA